MSSKPYRCSMHCCPLPTVGVVLITNSKNFAALLKDWTLLCLPCSEEEGDEFSEDLDSALRQIQALNTKVGRCCHADAAVCMVPILPCAFHAMARFTVRSPSGVRVLPHSRPPPCTWTIEYPLLVLIRSRMPSCLLLPVAPIDFLPECVLFDSWNFTYLTTA